MSITPYGTIVTPNTVLEYCDREINIQCHNANLKVLIVNHKNKGACVHHFFQFLHNRYRFRVYVTRSSHYKYIVLIVHYVYKVCGPFSFATIVSPNPDIEYYM